jgi:hypothetical protein
MRTQTLIFFLLLISLALQAQRSVIRGSIIDQQSETPLIGATVILLGIEPVIGTLSDAEGRFELKDVPVGRHSIQVSYLGYDPQTIPNLLVTAGRELQFDIKLKEAFQTIDEVVVKGNTNKDKTVNELATISARTFNTEEVLRYSGGRNDVAKLVANFAGVAANNDGRNDIIVRGNSPTGILWRMEGIPIPNPNHFSTLGTTGGPVSALNPNLIGTSDFLTSAFPAEYGNALAGVFDVNLRTGNKARYEFMGQINAFSGMEAVIEGPLNKKNGSFVVAYRHSFVEVATAAGINVGTAALPRYRDLTFNLDFGNTKIGKVSLFGIGASSDIDFLAKDIDENDFFADPTQDSYNTSRFGVLGLKHNVLLNKHAYVRSVFSTSYSGTTFEADNLTLENNPLRVINVGDDLTTYRWSSFYNDKINKRLTLRAGFLLQQQQIKTLVETRENTPDLDGDGRKDWWKQRDFDGGFFQAETFVQSQYRITEKLTLNAGLRSLYFNETKDHALEPRLAFNLQTSKKGILNLGYGLHHQTQPLPVFLFRDRSTGTAGNQDLGFTRSQHLVLGYDYKPADNWRIKVETYIQALDRVPVDELPTSFSMLNTGADFIFPEKGNLVNEGTGSNFGVELTVEKFFSKGYYGLLTVSVFDSKYKGSDGVERSTSFDGGYVFNFLAGKEFKLGASGRRFFTFDTKFTNAGGRPYTPVNLVASRAANTEILDESRAFSLRLDNYLRWDVKMGIRTNSAKRKMSQTFFLDFQNVTNNDNIFALRYNKVRGEVGRINQIGFFPDVMYRIEF